MWIEVPPRRTALDESAGPPLPMLQVGTNCVSASCQRPVGCRVARGVGLLPLVCWLAIATRKTAAAGGPAAPQLAAPLQLESVLDLGGASWTVSSSNGSVSAPAMVPGVVHTDLLRAGLIPEPLADFNELALLWIAPDPGFCQSLTPELSCRARKMFF